MMDVAKEAWKEPKAVLRLLALLGLVGIVVVAILRDRIVNPPQFQVSVMGQGEVNYLPDTARVSFGLHVDKAKTAEAAFNQLNEKMSKIVEAVKSLGIADEAITTTNYSLYPEYGSRPIPYPPISIEVSPDEKMEPSTPPVFIGEVSEITGYSADQQLSVKLEGSAYQKELLSKVIAEATKAGVNTIQGVHFETSQLDELKNEARIKAITDAREKASMQAAAAGVRLDKVVGWWENMIVGPTPEYAYGKGMYDVYEGYGGGFSPTLPAGQNKIVIEIGLNYLVK